MSSQAQPNPITRPLKALLDEMARIGTKFPEVEDTDVREQMHDAVYRAFVLRDDAYKMPPEFGMFTSAGNTAVHAALVKFLKDAVPLAQRAGLTSPRARLDAFQDVRVTGSDGQLFDAYFGAREEP
jgi:hypothetical protein